MESPFPELQRLFEAQGQESNIKVPTACCLSTIGLDGRPNARHLALKAIRNEGFFITGPLSRKAAEIEANPHVALTWWWPNQGVQVRVQGIAQRISNEEADMFFQARPREAQLTSWTSQQGQRINNRRKLQEDLASTRDRFEGKSIPRPETWSGFCITPHRIEILKFSGDRLHERTLYTKEGESWHTEILQP